MHSRCLRKASPALPAGVQKSGMRDSDTQSGGSFIRIMERSTGDVQSGESSLRMEMKRSPPSQSRLCAALYSTSPWVPWGS